MMTLRNNFNPIGGTEFLYEALAIICVFAIISILFLYMKEDSQ